MITMKSLLFLLVLFVSCLPPSVAKYGCSDAIKDQSSDQLDYCKYEAARNADGCHDWHSYCIAKSYDILDFLEGFITAGPPDAASVLVDTMKLMANHEACNNWRYGCLRYYGHTCPSQKQQCWDNCRWEFWNIHGCVNRCMWENEPDCMKPGDLKWWECKKGSSVIECVGTTINSASSATSSCNAYFKGCKGQCKAKETRWRCYVPLGDGLRRIKKGEYLVGPRGP